MKKRDRRQTPIRASLTAGWTDAVSESTGSSEKVNDTASAFYLDGEGTSRNLKPKGDKPKDTARIISKQKLNERRKKAN